MVYSTNPKQSADICAAARILGLELHILYATDEGDLTAAFAANRLRGNESQSLSRRALFFLLLVGASAPIVAQVTLEYDVEPPANRGRIYLPSIQLDNTSSDIDRKFAVSYKIHSQ